MDIITIRLSKLVLSSISLTSTYVIEFVMMVWRGWEALRI